MLITKYKVDPKTLQAILGHSNISTTLGYYTMVSEDQTRKTLEMYSKITGKSNNDKSKGDDGGPDQSESIEYINLNEESHNCRITTEATESRV